MQYKDIHRVILFNVILFEAFNNISLTSRIVWQEGGANQAVSSIFRSSTNHFILSLIEQKVVTHVAVSIILPTPTASSGLLPSA